jgi:uncharacterized lipoprotein YddW (UPF0748 family)
MRVLLAALVLSVCILVAPAALPSQVEETRALWVVRTSLTSPDRVHAMVAAAQAAGFNTLFVQVRGRGDAYYHSRVEPRAAALARQPAGFDPLAQVIREAAAAGLAVHAWINISLVADATGIPTARKHVAQRHPEWLMLPRELVPSIGRMSPKDPRYVERLASWTRSNAAAVEGLYTSPVHAGAVDHALDIVDDVIGRYEVDGLHLDYVRYPGLQFDFSRTVLDTFAEGVTRSLPKRTSQELKRLARSNPLVYVDRYPAAWQEFRRARMTALLRRIGARVEARRPGTVLSAAVVPDPGLARDSRGQDWPSWMRQGLLDVICPMVYTTDSGTFRDQVASVLAASAGRPVFAGVGAYRLTAEQTVRHVALARDAGADGFVLFSYDSLVAPERGPDNLAHIGRAVSGR